MSKEQETMGSTGDNYELDELLGAYALDAVDADEADRVEDYLQANPRAAAEVREHREIATMLAFTGMDAPADVWSRISAQIDAEAPAPSGELAKVLNFAPPSPGSMVAAVEPASKRPSRSNWLMGAAAAAALLFAGAVVISSSSNDPTDFVAAAFDEAVSDDASLRTELVAEGSVVSATGIIAPDGRGYLDATSLPALRDDMTYQLWGVLADSGDVVSIGIVGANPGLETFTVDGQVDALAITIEQSPGVVSDGNPDGAYVGALS